MFINILLGFACIHTIGPWLIYIPVIFFSDFSTIKTPTIGSSHTCGICQIVLHNDCANPLSTVDSVTLVLNIFVSLTKLFKTKKPIRSTFFFSDCRNISSTLCVSSSISLCPLVGLPRDLVTLSFLLNIHGCSVSICRMRIYKSSVQTMLKVLLYPLRKILAESPNCLFLSVVGRVVSSDLQKSSVLSMVVHTSIRKQR